MKFTVFAFKFDTYQHDEVLPNEHKPCSEIIQHYLIFILHNNERGKIIHLIDVPDNESGTKTHNHLSYRRT
jgi:hypothetical protein